MANWRRGFLRLWVVFSVLWIGGMVWMLLADDRIPSLSNSCSELLNFKVDEPGEYLTEPDVEACEASWRKKWLALINILLVPFVLLAIGLTIGWIVRGFRGKAPTT